MGEYDDYVEDPEATRSWFVHDVRADTPGQLGIYAAEPPRGMSNPPMSAKVRRELLQDILDNGTEVTVPDWPPPLRREFISGSQPATPSQSMTNFHSSASSSMSSSMTTLHTTGRSALSRVAMSQSYVANVRRGLIRNASAPAGSSSSQSPKGLNAPMWHTYAFSMQKLQPINRQKGFRAGTERSVHFTEGGDSSGDAGGELQLPSRGTNGAAEYIKTPSNATALAQARRQSLENPSGKRLAVDAPGVTKRSKDAKADKATEVSQDDAKKTAHVPEERELEEHLRGLRGRSQLHRAAVADRYRFGADASAGAPMVLKNTTAVNANPGVWASDAAFLNKFHNSAIRIVVPSGLKEIKQPKKRKKKKGDDVDDLKMSDSGLFVARYPIDESLKTLRRLRKKAFPEIVEEKPKLPDQMEQAAAKLKQEFGGLMLTRVHVKHDEEDALATQAVQESGY